MYGRREKMSDEEERRRWMRIRYARGSPWVVCVESASRRAENRYTPSPSLSAGGRDSGLISNPPPRAQCIPTYSRGSSATGRSITVLLGSDNTVGRYSIVPESKYVTSATGAIIIRRRIYQDRGVAEGAEGAALFLGCGGEKSSGRREQDGKP